MQRTPSRVIDLSLFNAMLSTAQVM